MTCNKCGEKPKNSCRAFPKAVIEIDNPEKIVLLRKVMVPASMGGREEFPPTIGKYHNVLLEYEADGSLFLYSSDGIPTQLSTDVTDLQRQLNALGMRIDNEHIERVSAIDAEADARRDADNTLSSRITALDDSLATVAKTGSYNDLSNKPTIGNGTLTVKRNGTSLGTFKANATANTDVNVVVPTKTSDLTNDGSDGASQYIESNDLATVATSGSYNDLTNKPTIGNATLTIKRNDTNAGTFTANATTNKSINIAVPTKTSDLTNDGSDGTSTYVETRNLPTVGNATLTITENNTSVGTFTANATSNKTINITSPTKTSDLTNDGADGTSTYVESDELPTVDTMYSSSSNNAIANSTVTNSLDRNVMTNLAVDSTPSTTTVNLSNTKTNLAYPSSSTTSSISLPVASSTQAGVMNSATFDAVTSNTNNINAILNGAVAISNLPASPTQAQLTTAWENETGLTSLINRASVYDVTNNKVWTYYTNDQTWHAASNTSQVTVNTFTNSSEGTIKGSTNDGQVFAENDGTGSVNGWDTLTSAVSSNTSKLATIAQGAEVNVQANWTQTNTNADDYIKNKPANLVQDANYVHTDNNFTTALKDKLNGISAGAEVNVQSDWSQTNTSADDYIKNKPANLVQDANYVHTDNNFTTTLKNKLDGIESGAEANVQADWSQTDTTADDYIKNKPTIPTVNNATLTIQKNGTNVQTFTANSSTNKTANITVPTVVSELTNDAGYATTTQLNNGLATKQDTLTAGDNIQINGSTISATDTTYTAGNAIDITNGEISADIHPADFFTAEDTVSDCGSSLSLDDTMASTLKSVELKGDTFQQTYSGEQLLTKNGLATPSTDTAFWNQLATGVISYTPLSDGWARVVQNSSGFGNIMVRTAGVEGFSTGTTYTVIFEIRNVSGAGTTFDEFKAYDIAQPTSTNDPWEGSTLQIVEGARWRSVTNVYVPLQDAQTPQYAVFVGTTKSSSTGYSLRTFTRSTVPIGTTLEVRATVLSGDHSSDWRNYCGENWQPFVGGAPAPNPDYPQDIQVVAGEQTVTVTGKNLFNVNKPLENKYLNSSGGWTTSTYSYVNQEYIVTGSSELSFSFAERNGSPIIRVGEFQTDGTFIKRTLVSTALTLTLDALTNKIIFSVDNLSPNYFDELQIELGSSPTTYQPYTNQSYTLDLGAIKLCKIGDSQDYIYKSGEDWYVHKEINTKTIDGTESGWGKSGVSQNTAYYLSTDIFNDMSRDGMGIGQLDTHITPTFSKYFVATSSNDIFTTDTVGLGFNAQPLPSVSLDLRIGMGLSSSLNTVQLFKDWLASNPVTVYYVLATATDTKITDNALVGQLEALAKAQSYDDRTTIAVAATSPNLLASLCVEAYRDSEAGLIELISTKQGLLTAGDNITIENGVISATNTQYIAGTGLALNGTTLSVDTSVIAQKSDIPTVNNATLTIQKNGTDVQTFTANSSSNKTANITVPTKVSELTNDSSFATTTQLNTGLAAKQNTLSAGSNITISGNTISAIDTKYTAGTGISISNGVISCTFANGNPINY